MRIPNINTTWESERGKSKMFSYSYGLLYSIFQYLTMYSVNDRTKTKDMLA